jgi:hypothetical protein
VVPWIGVVSGATEELASVDWDLRREMGRNLGPAVFVEGWFMWMLVVALEPCRLSS